MKLEKERRKKAGRAMTSLYLILVLFILLTVATYTWFSLTRTPRVSEMGMSVDCGTGLELAFEMDSKDDEWTQYLDFREKMTDMAPLKPVTWSEQAQSFYAAEFGADGRITGITERLTDEANTNVKTSNGYYMKNTCYARTGTAATVSLSPAITNEDGTESSGTYAIGTPVWDTNSIIHNNGGNGAEHAIRVGIRITKYDRKDLLPTGEIIFYIYEPNYDGHLDESITDVATPSIDGTATLVPAERLIRQTTSEWTEANPVQKDVIIRSLGEFTTETELFQLEPDELAKIDFYVWLEGQDVDCTNQIGSAAQVFVNIQFAAETDTETGLETIK